MPDFDNITYLANGTPKQQSAYCVLTQYEILKQLESYTPILVGTVPLDIDIEGSDLDILCSFTDKVTFKTALQNMFSTQNRFKLYETAVDSNETVIANFFADDWEIEIFGQAVPVKKQFGYRHMIIEHELLQRKGETLRQQIISLKQQGYKTEPAFAKALGLIGNPYLALLEIELMQF